MIEVHVHVVNGNMFDMQTVYLLFAAYIYLCCNCDIYYFVNV